MQSQALLRRPALASSASATRVTAATVPMTATVTTTSIRLRSRPPLLILPSRSCVALPTLVSSAYAAGRSYDDGDKLLRDWGGGGDDGGGASDDEGGGGGGGRGGRGGNGGNGKGPNGDDPNNEGSSRGPFFNRLALVALATLLALIAQKIWSHSRSEGGNEGRGSGSGGRGGARGASFASMTGALSSSSAPCPPPRHPPAIPPFSAADNADVQALRRLVREAFETLQAHGERLEALEPESENEGGSGGRGNYSPSRLSKGARLLRDAEAAARFAALGAMRRRAGGSSARRAAAASESASSSLEGEVVVDAGVANSNAPSSTSPSSSSSSASSFLPATRGRIRACLHGRARGGRDAWLAQVDAFGGHSSLSFRSPPSSFGSAALSKLLYSLQVGRRSRLLLSPLGCRGCDVAPTLNPTAGAGLTSAARDGSSPHLRLGGGEESGSGGGAQQAAVGWRHRWRGGAGVSAAAFHQPFPSSPSPLSLPQKSSPGGKTSTLIQLDGPLTDSLSAGVVAVLERPHRRRGKGRGRQGRDDGRGRAPSPSDTWERADSPSPASSSFGSEGEDEQDEDDLIYGGGGGLSSGSGGSGSSAATLGAMAAAALGEGGDITASAWACARVERAAASKPGQSAPSRGTDASPSSSPSSFPSASRGWGASLASRPSSGGSGGDSTRRQPGWILAVTGETPPAEKRKRGKRTWITAEASLVLPLDSNEGTSGGGSATLVPGVVFARRGGENSVSLACRSVLAF